MNPHPYQDIEPAVVAGSGSLARIPDHLPRDAGVALLVCDRGVADAGLVDRIRDAIGAAMAVECFTAPAGEPTLATIDAAAAKARVLDGPVVIGVGGGTALDVAKLVAGLARCADSVGDYALGRGMLDARAPLIMVPTTAGTGSEATATAVFSDGRGRKLWAWSPVLRPDTIVLDPRLTLSLPPGLSVATGLDAFAHALEAVSGQSTGTVVEGPALAALALATEHLARVVDDPADLDARQGMQSAALLAGAAIDVGGTGIAHNIAHALGTCHHVPHGAAVALGLQASLDWSIELAPARFAAAAAAFGGGTDVELLATRYDEWLLRLDFARLARMAIPADPDPGRLAEAMAADENAPMAANSARPPTAGDFPRLAERCVKLCHRHRERAGGAG